MVLQLIQAYGVSVVIQRPTDTVDSMGAPSQDWATATATETMFMQPRSGSESLRYGGDVHTKLVVFYAEASSVATEGDRLSYDGRYFRVLAVINPGEGQVADMAHIKIEAEEIEGKE